MHICLVTRFYPAGGIGAYAHYLAQGLVRHGNKVTIITQLAPGAQPVPPEPGQGRVVYRVRANLLSYRWGRLPLIGRQAKLFRNLLYAWRVRLLLENQQKIETPDLVEYADIEAEGLFHPEICPYIVKLHTPHKVMRPYYTAAEIPYERNLIEVSEARAIRRAYGVSSPSRWLAGEVANLCNLRVEDIMITPNPIDTDFFSPALLQNSGNPIVLYVGRLEARKGASLFASAIPIIADSVTDAEFVFLGADRTSPSGQSHKAELEANLARQGLLERVHFHGDTSREIFREFYRRASVFVMPSLIENCPYTLLEAMSSGLPCVVSRAGGMPEMIIDGETGLLFEAGNAAELAAATIDLLRSPTRRESLGSAARESILKNYSIDVGTEVTENFYRKVIASTRI